MRYLTHGDKVTCLHGGTVEFKGPASKIIVGGKPVLVYANVYGAQIIGCTVPPSQNSKPCTKVMSISNGIGQRLSLGDSQENLPLLETLTFQTDGQPVGVSHPILPSTGRPVLQEEP